MKPRTFTGAEVRERRKAVRMDQATFWQPFGVSQSTSSRHESGRDIPEPVQVLLRIAFGTDATSGALVESLRAVARPKEAKRQRAVRAPADCGMLP